MKEAGAHSAALQQMLLKSEKVRILGVLGFVVFFEVVYAVRIFLLGSLAPHSGLLAFPVFGMYELAVLLAVHYALAAKKDLPRVWWMFNIVLEMCMPALALAYLIGPRLPDYWAPLASPFVLTFFAFIILSTLRLDPWICRLAGIVGAASYFAAAARHGWTLSLAEAPHSSVTQSAVVVYGLILLGSGFVAGTVANEIRKYVYAVIQESENRQRLQQAQRDLQIARSVLRRVNEFIEAAPPTATSPKTLSDSVSHLAPEEIIAEVYSQHRN